jgi:hypothetical protein
MFTTSPSRGYAVYDPTDCLWIWCSNDVYFISIIIISSIILWKNIDYEKKYIKFSHLANLKRFRRFARFIFHWICSATYPSCKLWFYPLFCKIFQGPRAQRGQRVYQFRLERLCMGYQTGCIKFIFPPCYLTPL